MYSIDTVTKGNINSEVLVNDDDGILFWKEGVTNLCRNQAGRVISVTPAEYKEQYRRVFTGLVSIGQEGGI